MNWSIAVVAATFFWLENQHFGWNAWPKSDAELIADGIVCLLIAMSFIGGQTK